MVAPLSLVSTGMRDESRLITLPHGNPDVRVLRAQLGERGGMGSTDVAPDYVGHESSEWKTVARQQGELIGRQRAQL